MQRLTDLELFVRIADHGSVSAAARALELTPAAASAALKRLERELDTVLFVRSTRTLRLTTEGEIFLDHCRQALALLADGRDALITGRSVIRGLLQISAPSDLGRNVLAGWLDEFLERYPQVQIRLSLSDRVADVYRQPIDIALRYGPPADSSLIALPLAADNRRILCAAPDYLARYGTPQKPADLARHNCLCYWLGEDIHDRWRLTRDGHEDVQRVTGNRVADDGEMVSRWARAGRGIAFKSALDVADDLLSGRLIHLLPDWQGDPAPLNLVCADRRQLNPAVRALHQWLAERCASRLDALRNAGFI
ncbi:LysR family transcriptional regulator [Azonexus sp. IMCC34839]|uniref:LysR family transcriptional regulator n=1 Tax=Azonexus sp. IMCC34839 TaxID=3133695 RepID=UPI00399B7FCC